MRRIQVAVATVVGLLATSATADVTIRGRVTGADGRPVADAVVFCVKPARTLQIESVDGKANAEGLFELRLVGFDNPDELKPQSVLIYAAGHGLGVTTVGTLLDAPAESPPVTLSLPAETVKIYRVIDPQGQPVKGAMVDPVNYVYGSTLTATNYGPGCKLPEAMMPILGGMTDELGVVKFSALAAEKLRTIQVFSEQYGLQEVGNPARAETIRLQPTARVEIVFDQTHGTLEKCRVVAFASSIGPGAGVPFAPGEPLRPERSAVGVHYAELADGAKGIDMPAMAAGVLNFRLTDISSEAEVLPVWPRRILLEPGTSRTISVPLEKTIAIRGRVVDEMSRPCANVAIVVMNETMNNVVITRSDSEGRYRCRILKGHVYVSATRGDPTAVVYGSIPHSMLRQDGFSDLEFPDYVLTPDRVRRR